MSSSGRCGQEEGLQDTGRAWEPRTAQRALELALKLLGDRNRVQVFGDTELGPRRKLQVLGKRGEVSRTSGTIGLHFRATALLSLSRMRFSLSSFLGFCSGHQCDKRKTLLSRSCCSYLWPCDPGLEFSKWGLPFLPACNSDTVIPPPVTWKRCSHVAALRTKPHTEGVGADRRKEPGSSANSLSCSPTRTAHPLSFCEMERPS